MHRVIVGVNKQGPSWASVLLYTCVYYLQHVWQSSSWWCNLSLLAARSGVWWHRGSEEGVDISLLTNTINLVDKTLTVPFVSLLPFTNHSGKKWTQMLFANRTNERVTYMSSNQHPHWPWVSRYRRSQGRLCPIFFCIQCHGERRTWSQLTRPYTPSDTENERQKERKGVLKH